MGQLGVISLFVVGLFIVWFLLWKNYSKSSKQNKDRTFFLTTFVSTLATVATIIASTLSSSNQINQLQLYLQTSISNQLEQTVEQNQVVIVGKTEDISVEEQLQQAELAFHAEQYQQMETIYLNNTLKDSAIRNNNLGYTYANGLYVVPNLEIAEFYFDKAIAADFEPAYANKFRALMVQEKMTEAEDLILEWHKLKEHSLFEEYFNKNIASFYNGSVDDFCTRLTSDDRIGIIKKLLKNEFKGYIRTQSILYDSENGGYHYSYNLVNEKTTLNPDLVSSTTIMTYEQYKLNIVDDAFLNRFASLKQ